jgi:DnaD/phage-associated family protein
MANRRMIAKSISVSDETNALSDFAALLFTWLIPHSDDYGVIPGSPGRIKALVVPRRRQSETDIEAALEEMRRVGLIYRYQHGGHPYIQLVRFEQHQEGLHKRTAPRNPLYSPSGESGSDGGFPEVPAGSGLTEPKPNEPKPRERNQTQDAAERAAVVAMLERNVCKVTTPVEQSLIDDWLADTSVDWIKAAIRQAGLNKAGSLKYVDTILQAWRKKYLPSDQPWRLEARRKGRSSLGNRSGGSFIDQLAELAQEATQ